MHSLHIINLELNNLGLLLNLCDHRNVNSLCNQDNLILFLWSEGTSSSADVLMSESWEWREGRLLAYELILKFLITNHIHYVFPTYVLPASKGSATSSSVDETLISRYDRHCFKVGGFFFCQKPVPA